MNDDILTTLSLNLIDDEDQIYITEAFDVPNTMFRIAVGVKYIYLGDKNLLYCSISLTLE